MARPTVVADPLARPIQARWLRSEDGARAVIEMATASGLSRVATVGARRDRRDIGRDRRPDPCRPRRRRPLDRARDRRQRHDRWRCRASCARSASPVTERRARPGGLDRRLAEVDLQVACDVTNPLLGPTGAAAVYGPQKGASPGEVVELDARLRGFADPSRRRPDGASATRRAPAPRAGSGSACSRSRTGSRRSSFDPASTSSWRRPTSTARLATADLVITGEGRIDAQTAFGKTALGVAREPRAAGVPCIAVGGGVEPEGIEALRRGRCGRGARSPNGPQTVEEAMAAGRGAARALRRADRPARDADH